jgi:GDP-L-fucose synthase
MTKTHGELDLTNGPEVRAIFDREKPEIVVLAAAKVGGIVANDSRPAEFIRENLAIQTNVIHESWRSGVKRLLFLGSSCIYPRQCPQPIKEEFLLTGPLEPTNEAYALAKIAGIQMCSAYNRQYGTQFLCAMPTNLYGIGDNYNLTTSHVVPAVIRKAHEAKMQGAKELVAWGTGSPRRELLLSDDLAEACLTLLRLDWTSIGKVFPSLRLPLINVGTGWDLSIKELVTLICEVVQFDGLIRWDHSKPDGTPQKLLDIGRIAALGWKPNTSLNEGIRIAYDAFKRDLAPV